MPLAGGLLLTASCKKDSEVTSTDDVLSAQDASLGVEDAAIADLVEAAASQDVTALASATVVDAPELARRLPPWAFGTTNCRCSDGRCWRGVITAMFSGLHRHPGLRQRRLGNIERPHVPYPLALS